MSEQETSFQQMTSALRERYGAAAYVIVVVGFSVLLWEYKTRILAPIASPILGSYGIYNAFVFFWAASMLAGLHKPLRLVPTIADIIVLSNCYFGVGLSIYYMNFDVSIGMRWLLPAIATIFMMALRGESWREILFRNAAVVITCVPLLLQYVLLLKGEMPLAG